MRFVNSDYIIIVLTGYLQNMVHIAESTVGRRYAGWFIKNTERTQRIFDDLKTTPLPTPSKATSFQQTESAPTKPPVKAGTGPKVAWGAVKA